MSGVGFLRFRMLVIYCIAIYCIWWIFLPCINNDLIEIKRQISFKQFANFYHLTTVKGYCIVNTWGAGGIIPYKGLMGTCGQPRYVFRDFCLKQGIDFIIFCLNQGIDCIYFIDFCPKQGIFSWAINSLRVCSTNDTGYQKSEFCVKQGSTISDFCLKQGQGMRGRAAHPHPRIYRVPPGCQYYRLSKFYF